MYAGFILLCDNVSQEQCLREKKYACVDKKAGTLSKIKVGAVLFLYNVDDKSLLGPFTALSEGGDTVDSGAWAMKIDEHSASENVKLEWEDLHRLENAPAELPFLKDLTKCTLTTTQTERALDMLKQAPLHSGELQNKSPETDRPSN
jgi:Development and cell death domain